MPYVLDKDCPVWQKHNPLCGGKYWHYCQIIPDKEKELEEKTKRQKKQLKQVYQEKNELENKLTQSLEKNKNLEDIKASSVKNINDLSQQLKEEKNENSKLLAEVGKLSVEVDNKEKEIANKDKELEDLKKKLGEKSESEGESEGEVSDSSSAVSASVLEFKRTPTIQELGKIYKKADKNKKYEALLNEISDPNKNLEDLPLDFVDTRQNELGVFFSPKKQQILLETLKKRRNAFKQKKKE